MPPEANGGGDGDDRAGPRPTWTGTLSFGLVTIPVRVYPAAASRRGPSLRMVGAEGTPLRQEYVDPSSGNAVAREDLTRGYEVEDGRWVTVSREELEGLQPEKTREIELRRFVDAGELDPSLFDRPYILAPGEGGARPYRLLARVMEAEARVGIATFVLRTREHLVAILAREGILHAELLRFHDELRTPDDVGLPEPGDPDGARVEALVEAVEAARAEAPDPDELADRRALRLAELVEAREASGEDVVSPPPGEAEPAGTRVVDLMEALRRSLAPEDAAEDGKAQGRDLADLTRDELYERARALDIPGRSGMKKAELREAVARAS